MSNDKRTATRRRFLAGLALTSLVPGCGSGTPAREDTASEDRGREVATPWETPTGTNPNRDAGVELDGGSAPGSSCQTIPHDARLGTLRLQAGFLAAEAVQAPAGISALTAVADPQGFRLYGLRGVDKSLYDLGTWPRVVLGSKPLQAVIAPEDRASSVILGDFLANDGSRLLAGYMRSGSAGAGKVLVHDIARPSNPLYLPAPGNTSAAGAVPGTAQGSGLFFVNGAGLADRGAPGADAAIYALRTQPSPPQASKLATFEPAWAAVSAHTAVTFNRIAVLGYFSGVDFQVHLRAVSPAAYARALSTGIPLALGDWPEVHGGDLEGLLLAGFDEGLATHRGAFSQPSGVLDTEAVFWTGLSLDPSREDALRIGRPVPVLLSEDACTNVSQLVSLGADLLIAVSDKNGERLVRIKRQK